MSAAKLRVFHPTRHTFEMNLPGRLAATTLGDLLGTLSRASATGALELIDDRGRSHRVHVADGAVVRVDLDGAAPTLLEVLRKEQTVDDGVLKRSLLRAMAGRRLHGDVLVKDFGVERTVVERALRRQMAGRIGILARLEDANVRFRVALRSDPKAGLHAPLPAQEFLPGMARARDGVGRDPSKRAPTARPGASPGSRSFTQGVRTRALAMLGLGPEATVEDVRRAYRELVRRYHPDHHPGAQGATLAELARTLDEVTKAYRSIT